MGVFLLIILAIAVIGVLASLFSRLNELRDVVERLNAQAAERIRALETRLSAQERLTAELRSEIAESARTRDRASTVSSVKPPIDAPISAAEPEIPPSTHAEARPAPTAPFIAPEPTEVTPEPVPQATEAIPKSPPPLPQPASHTSERPAPSAPPSTALPAARALSLEERLGANWLNKLGIAILVIGLAFFLAVRLTTMSPGGKVLTGLAISLALLGGGIWLERRPTYRVFARAGIGGGWALLFFTTYAMHHLEATRIISSLIADLLLMLAVAAGMVLHSLRYRSQ